MNKLLGFVAGALCGAVVGAAAALVVTPTSGTDLRTEVRNRWDTAVGEARQEMERTQKDLESEFERMSSSS